MAGEGMITATRAMFKVIGAGASAKHMAFGTATVTGTLADIDTGLAVIDNVVVSIKDTNQAAGDGAYATVDHGADGLLDLAVWDDGGIAATNAATVYWQAIGTI